MQMQGAFKAARISPSSAVEGSDFFERLPTDVAVVCLSFLEGSGVSAAAQSCRALRGAAREPAVWARPIRLVLPLVDAMERFVAQPAGRFFLATQLELVLPFARRRAGEPESAVWSQVQSMDQVEGCLYAAAESYAHQVLTEHFKAVPALTVRGTLRAGLVWTIARLSR